MLKRSFLIVLLCLSPLLNAAPQNINTEENFPDPAFRTVVEQFMEVESGASFTAVEASVMRGKIDCRDQGIHDLTGIEFFTSITILLCSDNALDHLDISNNTALTKLDCGNNQLDQLDVTNNSALSKLLCDYNSLSELDVSQNPNLTQLICNNNQLLTLDVRSNPYLDQLKCHENLLRALDVSFNENLIELNCRNNQIDSLMIFNHPSLDNLRCESNQLTDINISGAPSLTIFNCSSNLLTALDVSSNIGLEELECFNNQLSSIQISNHPNLQILDCKNNQLNSLDLTNSVLLESIQCRNNFITRLDLSNLTQLQSLICDNNLLQELLLTNCLSIEELDCQSNMLSQLDLSDNTALDAVFCQDNQLLSLHSFVNNSGLELGDVVDVRDNAFDVTSSSEEWTNILELRSRIGDPECDDNGALLSGFAFHPDDCKQSIPSAYTYKPTVVLQNPFITEPSGIFPARGAGEYWGHNDSGDTPFIYRFNRLGEVLQIVTIPNAELIDWEAITGDGNGALFIADTGDNKKARNQYHIYAIPEPQNEATVSAEPQVYSFVYEGNVANDCESIFYFNGSLYLITKEFSFSLPSRIYRLPALDSNNLMTAELVGTLDIANSFTTDAAYSNQHKLLVVLTYLGPYFYSVETELDLLKPPIAIETALFGQCEGICFDGDLVLITNEEKAFWEFNLTFFIPETNVIHWALY